MLARTLFHFLLVGRRGPRLEVTQVSRSRFRVWPTDLDVLGHMNNGKYLSIMDVARFDLMQRTGLWTVFQQERWYPVVVGQTISYRKSLNPWRRFEIETKILGFDEQAVYLEQRFVRPSAEQGREVYARAFVRARVLRRRGGTVPVAEIMAKTGVRPEQLAIPQHVLEWGRTTRLPATRAAAPSTWD